MTAVGTTPEVTMKTVADAVKEGKCVLFLGAAVHAPPPPDSPQWEQAYPAEKRPCLAGALRERLMEGSGWTERYGRDDQGNAVEPWDLQRMAQFYELEHGRANLIKEIKAAVDDDKAPSPIVKALAELDFPIIITTNYDLMLDRALYAIGKVPRVTVYQPKPAADPERVPEPSVKAPLVFKMHGDVNHEGSIVITDEDYIQFVLATGGVKKIPITYTYHLTQWPTLFVGYSLLDYNLRLLFKMLRLVDNPTTFPLSYSVDHSPDPLIYAVWRQQVAFIAQNVWTFVPELYRQVLGKEMPT
jgi:SIR2-like protein